MQKLLAPREAANILGISYPTLKQWIYHGKIKSVKTPGGHHRVPESEIDRLFPKKFERGSIESRRGNLRKISGRNQLIGRVLEVKYSGLLAQVRLAIGEQHITAIITAEAAKEMRLKPGERAAALIKSTEVMILRRLVTRDLWQNNLAHVVPAIPLHHFCFPCAWHGASPGPRSSRCGCSGLEVCNGRFVRKV